MKIKYITNVRIPTPRAQGYAIMKMCSEFASHGAEVELLIPDKKSNEDNKNPFSYYGIKENFKIKRLFGTDLLGRFYNFGKFFYWIDIMTFLISARFFARIRNNDILYTRDFLTILFFSKKKNICLELHDLPTNRFLFKFILKKPEFFFVLNQNLKDDLVTMGVNRSKIHISPSGVDIEKFDLKISKEEARKKLNLPQNKKIVLYSGQLYSWKGAETLAEATRLVPEALFVFIGGIEPELSEFKGKYGKASNVTILSFQERSIIPLYLKAADILVLPNSSKEQISVRYTSPLKLFEYICSKRPIIASNLPSIREIVSNRECVFAESDNPASFAAAIQKVVDNPKLGESIAQNAYKKTQKFSWSERAGTILDFIKKRPDFFRYSNE